MKKSFTQSLAVFFILFFSGMIIEAQTVVVMPGNNSTSANGRAPQGTRKFITSKYIILASEMTASGFTGQVKSVGWKWNVPMPPAAAAPVAQSAASTGRLKVFLKDTAAAAMTLLGTTIDTLGVGYTKVIDGTINIPATASEINIDVPIGGPGTAAYTPAAGSAVLVIFVYTTTDAVLATPTTGAPIVSCTNAPAGTTLLGYQSQTVPGTTGTASAFRPETRFGTGPATPITLSSFKATYHSSNKITLLQWSTSQEHNSKSFVIERSTDGGRNFEMLGTIAAAGTSNSDLQYQFSDRAPVQGTNLFRLKQIDIDSRFQYSNIISVRIKEENSFSLYPNPANNFTLIKTTNPVPSPVNVQVINSRGRIIREMNSAISAGLPLTLNLSKIASGVYFVRIYNGNELMISKELVIQ